VGQWRGVDWLGAVFLLAFFFIIGIFALVHLASTKPGGTMTVTYIRASNGSGATGSPGAPMVVVPPIPDIASRLASLDELRTKGLITAEEWSARRWAIIQGI
jgi:hypothetical protein